MKRLQSTCGIKRRIAFAAVIAVASVACAAPVALASSSSVLGFGDNTVVVNDELGVDQKFSDTGEETSSASSLATPATRSKIVVKQEGSSASSGSAAQTVSSDGWMSGTASHYGIGDGFMGGTCADGSIVTETSMGVAMRNVALGTKVEISYNGKTVVATVVDRGPYHGGRVMDLQPAVARALGTVEAGVVTVSYRFI